MNTSLIEYELSTGQISNAYTFPEGEDSVVSREGYGYIDGHAHSDGHYVLDGVLTERPGSPVTLDGLILKNVPANSILYISGESYLVIDDEVELELPSPGTYPLRVECWPYKDWNGEVTV